MKKSFILFVILSLFFLANINIVFAQTNVTTTLPETDLVRNSDLGIGRPLILPGSPFYGFKTFWRHLRFALALNPQRKAELKLKYASERLAEINELIKKGAEKKETINKVLDKYQKDTEEAVKQLNKVKDIEKNEKFTQKYIDHALKHQIILQRLTKQVPIEVFEKIQEKRQRHLKQFLKIIKKVAAKKEIKKFFDKTIEKITSKNPGSRIRVQEILDELEENAPEKVKPKLEKIRKANIKKAILRVKKLPYLQRKRILERQLNKIANPLKAVEISNQLEKTAPELKPLLKEIKEKPINRFIKRRLKKLPLKKKEKILERLINNKERHLKTLKGLQEKIEKTTPEESVAPDVLRRVIKKQEEKIEKIKKLKEKIKENSLKKELEGKENILKKTKNKNGNNLLNNLFKGGKPVKQRIK